MPLRSISLEHHPQTTDVGCLAACTQMVLQTLGFDLSQRRLNELLGLTPLGIPYSRLTRLTQVGVEVRLLSGDPTHLQAALDHGHPLIAFVHTGDLPYWSVNTPHAVVVSGYDETCILLHDPAFPTAPQTVPWPDFILAWGEMEYSAALITHPK